MKTLNVELPESTYEELKELSEEHDRTLTELIRTALGMVGLLYQSQEEGKELVVRDSDTHDIERVVICPGTDNSFVEESE